MHLLHTPVSHQQARCTAIIIHSSTATTIIIHSTASRPHHADRTPTPPLRRLQITALHSKVEHKHGGHHGHHAHGAGHGAASKKLVKSCEFRAFSRVD